jgi:hypothetical protein
MHAKSRIAVTPAFHERVKAFAVGVGLTQGQLFETLLENLIRENEHPLVAGERLRAEMGGAHVPYEEVEEDHVEA